MLKRIEMIQLFRIHKGVRVNNLESALDDLLKLNNSMERDIRYTN